MHIPTDYISTALKELKVDSEDVMVCGLPWVQMLTTVFANFVFHLTPAIVFHGPVQMSPRGRVEFSFCERSSASGIQITLPFVSDYRKNQEEEEEEKQLRQAVTSLNLDWGNSFHWPHGWASLED